MTNVITKFHITIKCLACCYEAKIEPGDIPVGDCMFCKNDFGWAVFPEYFRPPRYPFDVPVLESGDIVVVNTMLPVTSVDRIYEIRRGGVVFYSKEAKKEILL